jgi:Tol biopolymer transport system component
MPSLIPTFVYDIFISYRHNDNRSDWVTEFVKALQEELAATIKVPISIYFDQNPHDGLLETHDVDDSLKEKLKSLIFIPIISQTYCDTKSFAWSNEFLVFLKITTEDSIGLKVRLLNGNIASRVLPIRIHELDAHDKKIIETELGPLRAIDFTYQSAGVNRPLRPKDDEASKGSQNVYRDQINKTANAIKDIIAGIHGREGAITEVVASDAKNTIGSTFIESRRRKKWKLQLPTTRTLLIFCLMLIALLIAALLYTTIDKSSSEKNFRIPTITSINLPDSLAMSFMAGPLRIGRRAVDISPDGKTIVYVSMDSTGASYLNLRPIGGENVLSLPGTKGAFSPFFSPDSKWIAFFADDKLIKISVDGTIKETITQAAIPVDGIWGTDDRIVWSGNESISFNSINSHGADRKLLRSTMRFFSRPIQLSSDTYIATNHVNETYVLSFKKGVEKLILSSGSCQAIYNHELFFLKETDLFAIGFDENKQVTVGNPRLIEKGISRDAYFNGQVSISSNGTLVYANGTNTQLGGLVWRSDKGELSNLPFKPEWYGTFSLSPDGKNMAIIKRGEQTEVWNYDLSGTKNHVQLSQQGFITNVVVWAPNSNWIYYLSYENAKLHVARRDASGRSDEDVILSNDSLRFFTDVDKNGLMLCSTIEKGGSSDLNFYSSDDSDIRYSFTSRKGVNETLAKFIHDDWVAFTSDQTGRSEVFISDLLNPGVRIQVSFEGGEEPRYHATDKMLYYRNGNKLMAISLIFDTTRKASLGTSKIIFEDDYWVNVASYSYDISSDGHQFLLIRATGKRETTEIKVKQNFSIK